MDSSTYYQLNLVTGSDNVNPLTIDRPNYEKIDTQMHNNEIAAISQASELKSGTVHAITCLTEDAVFIKFTSGSDYRSGDTFTYNGEIIRAVSPDGSSLKDYAFRVNSFVLAAVSGGQLTIYSSGAPTPTEIGAATAADAFANYACVTTSRNHALTGTGNNIKFTADARYSSGNTITVNGGPVSAQLMDGSALPDGLWASGAVVSCFLNEGVLTFKSGGGVDVSSATASADKVLAPYTFFAGTSTKKTGTMADYAAKTAGGSVSTDGENVVTNPTNSGYYTNSSKITVPYSSAANAFGITADKILENNTILGIAGTVIADTLETNVPNARRITSSSFTSEVGKRYLLMCFYVKSNESPSQTFLNNGVVGGDLLAWWSSTGAQTGSGGYWFQIALVKATAESVSFLTTGDGLYCIDL